MKRLGSTSASPVPRGHAATEALIGTPQATSFLGLTMPLQGESALALM